MGGRDSEMLQIACKGKFFWGEGQGGGTIPLGGWYHYRTGYGSWYFWGLARPMDLGVKPMDLALKRSHILISNWSRGAQGPMAGSQLMIASSPCFS